MLLTKLHIPPAGNNIVHRSVLHEKLNAGLSQLPDLKGNRKIFGWKRGWQRPTEKFHQKKEESLKMFRTAPAEICTDKNMTAR
jgi:hypothetical protein